MKAYGSLCLRAFGRLFGGRFSLDARRGRLYPVGLNRNKQFQAVLSGMVIGMARALAQGSRKPGSAFRRFTIRQ